jgi:hypothetical protein
LRAMSARMLGRIAIAVNRELNGLRLIVRWK